MNRQNRISSIWQVGNFLLIQSIFFAGFTRIADSTKVFELHWALPVVGIILCIFFGARCVIKGGPLATVFFALVFAIIWFLCLSVNHVAVGEMFMKNLRYSVPASVLALGFLLLVKRPLGISLLTAGTLGLILASCRQL